MGPKEHAEPSIADSARCLQASRCRHCRTGCQESWTMSPQT